MDIEDIRVLNIVTDKSMIEQIKAEKVLSEMAKSVGEDEEPKHYEYYIYLVRLTSLIRKGILDVLDGTKSHDDFILQINTLLERGSEKLE